MAKKDLALERKDKLESLAERYGYVVQDLLAEYQGEDAALGICMNPGCLYSAEYKPDQKDGWCEDCQTPTVTSCLVLAGLL